MKQPFVRHDRLRGPVPVHLSEGFHNRGSHRDYHTHDLCELAYVFGGSGDYWWIQDGTEHHRPIGRRTLALFSGHVPHRNTDPDDPLAQLILVFDRMHFECGANADLMGRLFDDRTRGPFIRTLNPWHARQVEGHLRRLLPLSRAPGGGDPLDWIAAFNGILQVIREEARGDGKAPARDPLSLLMEQVQVDPTGPWRLGALAESLGISERQFANRFREKAGTSWHAWVLGQRMDLAESLVLERKLPMTRIAFECGFESVSAFSRQYKKTFGVSPTGTKANAGADEAHSGPHLKGSDRTEGPAGHKRNPQGRGFNRSP